MFGKLGRGIEEFRARYQVLASPTYETRVYSSGDPEEIADYESTRRKAGAVVAVIDGISGAWAKAKEWAGLGSLAAIPLIPVAVVAGATASILAGVALLDDYFLRSDARRIAADNPGMSFDRALELARDARKGIFEKALDTAQLALVVGAAGLLFLFLRR